MKRFIMLMAVGAGWLAVVQPPAVHARADKLVYADFEKMENNRPVSARGGFIQMFGFQESDVHKSTFKGIEGADPPVPELVHTKKDDPNHLMKFDYSLLAPNQWCGVAVEIHGQPDADGKPVPDDVSEFKTLSVEVYATGTDILRLEAISKGHGKDTGTVYPLYNMKVRPGLNTYKVPLKGFAQPSWVDVRVDPMKEIFKYLTAINVVVFCDQCEVSKQGMLIVDNIVFEK